MKKENKEIITTAAIEELVAYMENDNGYTVIDGTKFVSAEDIDGEVVALGSLLAYKDDRKVRICVFESVIDGESNPGHVFNASRMADLMITHMKAILVNNVMSLVKDDDKSIYIPDGGVSDIGEYFIIESKKAEDSSSYVSVVKRAEVEIF